MHTTTTNQRELDTLANYKNSPNYSRNIQNLYAKQTKVTDPHVSIKSSLHWSPNHPVGNHSPKHNSPHSPPVITSPFPSTQEIV